MKQPTYMTAAEYQARQKAKNGPKFKNRIINADDPRNPFGVKFDSKIEFEFYSFLKDMGIRFEFQKEFTLLPTLEYRLDQKKVQVMKCKIDFWFPNHRVLCDVKGQTTRYNQALGKHVPYKDPGFNYRVRLLKHMFAQKMPNIHRRPPICIVTKQNYMSFASILNGRDFRYEQIQSFMI